MTTKEKIINIDIEKIAERLDKAHRDVHETRYWAIRSEYLILAVLFSHSMFFMWVVLVGTPKNMAETANDLHQILFLITMVRDMWHGYEYKRAVGYFSGMVDTLVSLGIIDLGDKPMAKRKRRKWRSPIARFEELFERIKAPQASGAYASNI